MRRDVLVSRVLEPDGVWSLDDYAASGGGSALERARSSTPGELIGLIDASGLRGRGGAGFPTGRKWRIVAESRSDMEPTTVVVNAAEGEPGTFKDRALLRTNPYRCVEGAALAALAVGSTEVVIGIKASFGPEIDRLRDAIADMSERSWLDGLDIRLLAGPGAYLFGEETALLEVVEGRQPFPRVTPPYRRGLEEDDTRSAAGVHLAGVGGTDEPPALVDNVETLSDVPLILHHGVDWFRELGTDTSPGTVVCTISGATRRHGVGEVPLGTTLREAIDAIGWGPRAGASIGLVVGGTTNALIPSDLLDTPLTYEAMAAAGTGLGSAGFIMFDDNTDPVAVAQGISRFLGVESCGQCEPCKRDGLALSELLDHLRDGRGDDRTIDQIRSRVDTVPIGARCNLARQQAEVLDSLLRIYSDELERHATDGPHPVAPITFAPIENLTGGRATLSSTQQLKQPDWSTGHIDSGTTPAARLGDTPVHIPLPPTRQGRPRWTCRIPDDHPLGILADAHDALFGQAAHCTEPHHGADPEPCRQLATAALVHVDATRRVLYPMARRTLTDNDGVQVVDRAESQEDELVAVAHAVIDRPTEAPDRLDDLLSALRRHASLEEQVVELLRDSMDPVDRDHLANGIAEAMTTSLAPEHASTSA